MADLISKPVTPPPSSFPPPNFQNPYSADVWEPEGPEVVVVVGVWSLAVHHECCGQEHSAVSCPPIRAQIGCYRLLYVCADVVKSRNNHFCNSLLLFFFNYFCYCFFLLINFSCEDLKMHALSHVLFHYFVPLFCFLMTSYKQIRNLIKNLLKILFFYWNTKSKNLPFKGVILISYLKH